MLAVGFRGRDFSPVSLYFIFNQYLLASHWKCATGSHLAIELEKLEFAHPQPSNTQEDLERRGQAESKS